MPIKEFIMECVTLHLMHEMIKEKEKNTQGDDVTMVTRYYKGGNPFTHKDIRTSYNCSK